MATERAASPSVHALLDNYLAFLAAFRGQVSRRADGVVVESDRVEFRYDIPASHEALEPSFVGSILALPWIDRLEPTLIAHAFTRAAEIVFMSKAVDDRPREPVPGIDVREARDAMEVEVFSDLQSRGFIEDADELADWAPWLTAANVRNLSNAACHFLLADLDGQPSAVTLVLESPGACGIYAVATPAAHQRRGLAARLLEASEAIARQRGYEQVCLQVYAGTYAHGFYERRGFGEAYRVGVWQRPPDA